MLNSVILQSSRGSHKLTFSLPKGATQQHPVSAVIATLSGRDWLISTTVYLYEPAGLIAFFEDLATPAWSGERQWSSIENHLVLRGVVQSSELGQSDSAALHLQLTPDPDQPEHHVQAVIHLELMELGAIAAQIKQLLLLAN